MAAPVGGPRKIEKGRYLFRENDVSDAMFVIKSGKIAIVKSKGNSEIVLAELGPGQMLGEMAFFDNRPRSASAKAGVDSEVIALPFNALYAQFKTFPEWLKAMVKTVNNNLRDANQRIKNLERAATDEDLAFPPHRITKLTGILALVAHRYGEKEGESISVPFNTLRRYTIQVFQEPTNKMQKLMEIYCTFKYMTLEDLGEGRQKILIHKLDLLINMVDFYTEFLFKEESKRTPVEDTEVKVMRAILHYGNKSVAGGAAPTEAKVSLVEMQNESEKDLGYLIRPEDLNSLIEKKLVGVKMSTETDTFVKFNLTEMARIFPYWEIVHTLLKVKA